MHGVDMSWLYKLVSRFCVFKISKDYKRLRLLWFRLGSLHKIKGNTQRCAFFARSPLWRSARHKRLWPLGRRASLDKALHRPRCRFDNHSSSRNILHWHLLAEEEISTGFPVLQVWIECSWGLGPPYLHNRSPPSSSRPTWLLSRSSVSQVTWEGKTSGTWQLNKRCCLVCSLEILQLFLFQIRSSCTVLQKWLIFRKQMKTKNIK